MKTNVLFFKTFMHLNMHDGIDFYGFNKLKPNSSGQFFKLYPGIVGFSNVLF